MRKRWHNFLHGSENETASGKRKPEAVPAGSGSGQRHKGAPATRPTPPPSKQRSNSSSIFKTPAWRNRLSFRPNKAPTPPPMVERAPLPPSPTGLVRMNSQLRQWRTDYVESRFRTTADNAGQKSRKAQRAERMFAAMDEYTRQTEERERRDRREKEEREQQERLDAILAKLVPQPPMSEAASRRSSIQIQTHTQTTTPKIDSHGESYGNEYYIGHTYHQRRSEQGSRISRMPSGPSPIIVKPIERLPNPIEWDWHKQNHPKKQA